MLLLVGKSLSNSYIENCMGFPAIGFILPKHGGCVRRSLLHVIQGRRLKRFLQSVRLMALVVFLQNFLVIHAWAVDPVIVNCVETPGIEADSENYKPAVFNLTNDLTRRTGSAVVAEGEVVYLVGRVTDSLCRPVSNVSVFVWQADYQGLYSKDMGFDKRFNGSGKATTDNLGNFGFITIIPGVHFGGSPRVHFLVKHPELPDFQTEMFFEGKGSEGHSSLSRIPGSMRKLLTARLVGEEEGVKTYEFNLTFPGKEDIAYE